MTVRVNPVNRLLDKIVVEEGHWLWTGAVNNRGYGVMRLHNGLLVLVHRFVYEVFVGPIPPERPQIDHGCDCRRLRCVTPETLEPVTNEENQRRAVERRRQLRGAV